ncbi:MAG: diaminopimelate decarboxylase [Kiritimatiellia bacterium]
MKAFGYQGGELQAEGVSVRELAERYGTPLYIYSRTHFISRYRALAEAMKAVKPLLCYSVKANSNGAVLRTFADLGSGFDIVSGGELYRVRHAGVDPSRVVYAGVGKSMAEIEYALREGILFFTVESEPEAAMISAAAQRLGVKGRVAFRVNPGVDPKTHTYISTGKKENKFGLDLERVRTAYAAAARMPNLEIAGLHMHIGSQILGAEPFAEAMGVVAGLAAELKAQHPTFRYMDIGGGIGIQYKPEQAELELEKYAAALVPWLKKLDLQAVMEPGRTLVGNGGMLVARVVAVKESYFKKFVVIDAGMNDLIRPALYQAHHEVLAVKETAGKLFGDLVGPICESGDFLAADRELPAVQSGDLVAVMSAGAYGFSMSSTYNSRPRVAEVMVEGSRQSLVREREVWPDLVRGEQPFAQQGA